MDSLKETDKPAPNPSKHPRIEVDEELMRQMIAGQAPLDSKVVRRIPEPEEEDTDTPEGNTSETVSGASAPTAEKTDVDTQTTTGKESAGFRRKKLALPDFERMFFAPVVAVIALRSMSVPKPSAKCRQSSTCWETIRQGLRHWPTICCGSSWTFTATS